MSLRLRQAIPGAPNLHSTSCLDVISTGSKALIAYASGTNVILVTPELELRHTLQFWSALPYRAASSSSAQVEGVLCSSKHRLILAWSGPHVAVWSYRTSRQASGWVVHSSLVTSADVTCMDFQKDSLVLGTKEGLEYWRTDLSADVTVWDRLWERKCPSPSSVCISPLTGHVAWTQSRRSVWILGVHRTGELSGAPQEIRQPKDVDWIGWRQPGPASGDAHLYTLTRDSVLRVYSPVLDDPTWFQLQMSMDPRKLDSGGTQRSAGHLARGRLSILKADPWRSCIGDPATIMALKGFSRGIERKALDALDGEESDVAICVKDDGSLWFRSITNMDRKPPTLLKALPLCRSRLPHSSHAPITSHTKYCHLPETGTILAVNPPTVDSPKISGYRIAVAEVLVPLDSAMSVSPMASISSHTPFSLGRPVKHFSRTPNGRGLLAFAEGEITVWYKEKLGRVSSKQRTSPALTPKGQWKTKPNLRDVSIYAKGRAIISYYHAVAEPARITLQHLDQASTKPTEPVDLPDLDLPSDDRIEILQGFSDVDDGMSDKRRRTEQALVIAASRSGTAWVWYIEPVTGDGPPNIKLTSRYRLPSASKPSHILPVDPMGWHQSVIDWKNETSLQDMILTVSQEGLLEFWSPRFGQHLAANVGHVHAHGTEPWYRTGVVHTSRTDIAMVRCSSRKKTVIVSPLLNGETEVTIWDSYVSEFSIGLEMRQVFEKGEMIQDLDWTTTSDLQSILAIGFAHRIELWCEQRFSDIETKPGWASFVTINLEKYTSVPISDSIWLAGGSLAVATENQLYLFSRFLDTESPVPSPSASVEGASVSDEPEDIFQLVAWQNGPLWDYHPTLLAQCLLWEKLDLARAILLNLVASFEAAAGKDSRRIQWKRLDPMDFARTIEPVLAVKGDGRKYDSLFNAEPLDESEDRDKLAADHVARLVDFLLGPTQIPLSRSERSQLATIAQALLEVERQRRSLDMCGMRYLLSIRMLANQNRLAASGSATPISQTITRHDKPRLSFRNIVWALHSESQDVLVGAATECCEQGRMAWDDAKRLGVFLWLKSSDQIRTQLEVVARNRFMADEARDPTSCSLIFFALGKKKVVHGLWRQAPGHKEQALMLKFLANDFELERWRTAATKNAYALLSKQRYEYAAAFFMLAGSPKDAINVVLRQMNDWQLAVAIARAVEEKPDGPLMQSILSDTVLPRAFAGGHRWLATWAFWQLGRRDLAVRIIVSPMADVASAWSPAKELEVGMPENDDPSLLLLFRHLKSRSLQTAKGTSEIPPRLEFDFVLHNAKMFFRMGCHPLALDLLRSWSFDRPFFPIRQKRSIRSSNPPTPGLIGSHTIDRPPMSPPMARRRPSFMLSAASREATMIMDLDPMAEQSEPVTRVPSPEPQMNGLESSEKQAESHVAVSAITPPAAATKTVEDKEVEPKKVGNLMKELKQDVQQGAMEFNMDNFF